MLQSLLALAAACKVLTELISNGLLSGAPSIPDAHKSQLKLLVSVIVGVVAAFTTGQNVFTAFTFQVSVPPLIGVLVTGVVVGFGSNVVNEIFDVLQGWSDAMNSSGPSRGSGSNSG